MHPLLGVAWDRSTELKGALEHPMRKLECNASIAELLAASLFL
jgi:hypothetical protein